MKKTFYYVSLLVLPLIIGTFTFKSIKIGAEAPGFSLKNVDGKMVSLTDFASKKGVILVFTCNQCPYAKLYEERIKALNAKYAAIDWPVVAINPSDPSIEPEDSYERMQEVAKEKAYRFPYLADANQEVYPKYGATRTPQVFLLENTRKGFRVAYIGAIDDNAKDANAVKIKYVEDAIAALNAGKKIAKTETAAIGCSIKSKK